jgi:hypothetical protein
MNASNIRFNTLEVRSAAALYPSHAALQVWGDYNAIDLIAVGATHSFGAKFEPGSNNNILIYGTLNATTPIANYGADNTFIPTGGGAGGAAGGKSLPDPYAEGTALVPWSDRAAVNQPSSWKYSSDSSKRSLLVAIVEIALPPDETISQDTLAAGPSQTALESSTDFGLVDLLFAENSNELLLRSL